MAPFWVASPAWLTALEAWATTLSQSDIANDLFDCCWVVQARCVVWFWLSLPVVAWSSKM